MSLNISTRNGNSLSASGAGVVAILFLGAATIAAWATHVVWIIRVLMSDAGATIGQVALGVLGAFMPPIGVIHGLMLWFS